jgi:riboflavin synthase
MFAGIIAAVGTVSGVDTAPRRHADGALAFRLNLDLGGLADGLRLGASVAVNGACLTLAEQHGTVGGFDVVPETWRRTTLSRLRVRDAVNLERSLRVGDPVDGHFVQGHVEGIGVVERVEHAQGEWLVWVRADAALMPAIIPKGSIALDGTSLTIVDAAEGRFSVALVPTTLAQTVLARRRAGDSVNIETDVLARLLVRRLEALTGSLGAPAGTTGLSWEKLRESGFVP